MAMARHFYGWAQWIQEVGCPMGITRHQAFWVSDLSPADMGKTTQYQTTTEHKACKHFFEMYCLYHYLICLPFWGVFHQRSWGKLGFEKWEIYWFKFYINPMHCLENHAIRNTYEIVITKPVPLQYSKFCIHQLLRYIANKLRLGLSLPDLGWQLLKTKCFHSNSYYFCHYSESS